MQPFQTLTATAAKLDQVNVDTDQIIPKQFLKKIERTGFGIHLFHDWRFLDDAGQKTNPDFILNQSRYQRAQILVAGDNFGCGSSREHAPWALLDYGFEALLPRVSRTSFTTTVLKMVFCSLLCPKLLYSSFSLRLKIMLAVNSQLIYPIKKSRAQKDWNLVSRSTHLSNIGY